MTVWQQVRQPLCHGRADELHRLQPLSCIRCAHRKVKCDRVDPCSNCVKHSVPCEYRHGTPYKRKKKHHSDSGSTRELQARIDKYEDLLKGLGVDPASFHPASGSDDDSQRPSTPLKSGSHQDGVSSSISKTDPEKARHPFANPPRPDPVPGRLIVQHGKSRYVEGNIWTKMGELIGNASELLPDSSDDEDEDEKYMTPGMDFRSGDLVLGPSPRVAALYELHPSPAHFAKLWRAFIDNVQPITMVLHAPSARQTLLEAIKSQHNAPKDVEALLFAVLATAVKSLTDDDCRKQFLESRASLLAKYRHGARQALSNAKFLLSSSFAILQAYTLYLFSIWYEIDPRALWNLSGIAVRNGQRLGLHKDLATSGLTPFEVEMRRRLWYQIVILDVSSCQQSGCSTATIYQQTSLTPPANVNDSDLDPAMTEPPKDREGATEMLFCRLRFKLFTFLKGLDVDKSSLDEGRWSRNGGELGVQDKDKLIDEMEREVELEVLRYCDFLQPIHFLTTSAARLVICKMRFGAHHPRRFQSAGVEIPQAEKEFLFKTALKVIEYDNIVHAQPMVKRFMWHSYLHFQWGCLVHVLSELKTRTRGEEVDRAWDLVREAYDNRPDIALGKTVKFPLYSAVNRVALDAWACREKALASFPDEPPLEVPDFIAALREQQQASQGSKQLQDSRQQYTSAHPMPSQQYPTPTSFESSISSSATGMPPQQQMGTTPFSDPYSQLDFTNVPVDWSLFDSLINGDMVNSFGDATLGGSGFHSDFWDPNFKSDGAQGRF